MLEEAPTKGGECIGWSPEPRRRIKANGIE